MKPSRTTCLTFLLTVQLIATTVASPVNEFPEIRHQQDNHHYKKLYATSDTSHVADHSDTRDVSHTSPNGFKRYKSMHDRRDMGADDLRRAARQSRREQDTSREQPSNANGWLTSFTKLFGIGVNEEDTENGAAIDNTDDKYETHSSQERPTHQVEPVSFKRNFDLDPHHPADFGSEEEIHTSLVEPETDTEKESKVAILDDDELISKTDLQDLVRLFRRMFTTLEKELNQTKIAAQNQHQSSTSNDLNSALAQAQALNRRKELDRKRVLVQASGDDEAPEREEEDADHEQPSEFPLGSPAYESRKRIMRGLNGVVEKDRTVRRRAVRHHGRTRDDDREHFYQAISAGLLPYL